MSRLVLLSPSGCILHYAIMTYVRDVHIGFFMPFSRGNTLSHAIPPGEDMDAVIQHFFVLLYWPGKNVCPGELSYGTQIVTRRLLATSAVDSIILCGSNSKPTWLWSVCDVTYV